MLPGMLLHVIETPAPVDLRLNYVALKRLGKHMRDPLALVDDICNGRAAQSACIVGLAAGTGIKVSLVQIYPLPILRFIYHLGVKSVSISVLVVKSGGRHSPEVASRLAS